MTAYCIEHYLKADGKKDLYIDWLGHLRDGKAKSGDKRTQDTDIDHAVDYWQDWQRRIDE